MVWSFVVMRESTKYRLYALGAFICYVAACSIGGPA